MLVTIILALAFVILTVASLIDLKTGEVPDEASIGLATIILLITLFLSIKKGEFSLLFNVVALGVVFFGVGYVLFRLGQWGGGDVKLVGGIGCLLSLLDNLNYPWPHSIFFTFPLTYWVNMAAIAFPYVILYGIVLAFLNPELLSLYFHYINSPRSLLLLLFSFIPALLSIFLPVPPPPNLTFIFLLLPIFTLASFYLRVVEEKALQKTIPVEELKIGDIVANDVVVDGKLIASKRYLEGVTSSQVEEIKRLAKENKIPSTITIKWGVKFAPVLFISLLLTLYVGNVLELFLFNIP